MKLNSKNLGIRVPLFWLCLSSAIVAVPALGSASLSAPATAEGQISNLSVALTPAVGAVGSDGVDASENDEVVAPDRDAMPRSAVSSPAELDVAETAPSSAFDTALWATADLGGIDPAVFSLALTAAENAVARGDADPETLTVIDFSRASTVERMWVYDLRTRELLFKELVSHGRNSGHNLATSFSNTPESHKSSLGLYRTAEGYIGKHGYSLRLDGLEAGFNDRARERAIVIHGAEYVGQRIADAQGRLGRSLGCPAVRPEVSRQLIDTVKDGDLVFAYYPDPAWLNTSEYLTRVAP